MRDLVVRSLIRMNKREAEWDKQARNGEMNLRKTMREELAQIREKNWWTGEQASQNKTRQAPSEPTTVLYCAAVLLYCCTAVTVGRTDDGRADGFVACRSDGQSSERASWILWWIKAGFRIRCVSLCLEPVFKFFGSGTGSGIGSGSVSYTQIWQKVL